MALCWTLDKLGPLCLTADDCGLVLEAIAGTDTDDPTDRQPWSATARPFARLSTSRGQGRDDGM
jgi:aspartyl-tRNA(Asn)/glutamyl-tRNA(Gln) amidotransferase subunit A